MENTPELMTNEQIADSLAESIKPGTLLGSQNTSTDYQGRGVRNYVFKVVNIKDGKVVHLADVDGLDGLEGLANRFYDAMLLADRGIPADTSGFAIRQKPEGHCLVVPSDSQYALAIKIRPLAKRGNTGYGQSSPFHRSVSA